MAYTPMPEGWPNGHTNLNLSPLDVDSGLGGIGQSGLSQAKTNLETAKQWDYQIPSFVPNYPLPQSLTDVNPVYTANQILEDIAKRGMERPHNLPEAEIQIMAAFILGHITK